MAKNTELNFLLFGFMINFVWKMIQMPLFKYPKEASLIESSVACIQASARDAMMLVIAFWILAALLKSREWIFHLDFYRIVLFLVPGIVFTVLFEALATGPLHRWEYGDLMPTLPVLGAGLAPIAQWLIIPPFVLWVVRRRIS